MCAVSHYLEEEGIATTLISLIREHSDAMSPPRALWVPFMLGRPFGAAHDAGLQSRVLRAALALLDEPHGPVTRDFPEDAGDAPDIAVDGDACPVNFSAPAVGNDPDALSHALRAEIAQLQPWHDEAVRTSGRSTVGVSGLTPLQAGERLLARLDGNLPDASSEGPPARLLKFAADDLRAFYEEAAGAQPGALSARALQRWYYRDTVAGRVLHALRDQLMRSDDPALAHLGKLVLIPRAILMESKPGTTP